MSEFQDRVVVVTGASGNLGAATSRMFAEAGARLVLLDRSKEHLTHAFGDLPADRHQLIATDLTDEVSVATMMSEARVRAAGRLDALVCTVGGYLGSTMVHDTDWAAWERMLVLNVKTALACANAVLPHFQAQGGGSIVVVASMAALQGGAGESAYAGSKAALLRLTESLAAENKGLGIRVNAVLPGTIDTPQNRAWMSEEQAKVAVAPRAIADVIRFLSSDAARAVTGNALRVTGSQ